MGSVAHPPSSAGADKAIGVVIVWLMLGFLWLGALAALAGLVNSTVAGPWVVSAFVLAAVVAWWRWNSRRQRRTVAAIACWWTLATLGGPAAFVLALPVLGRFRVALLEWIAESVIGRGGGRRWTSISAAFVWHLLAAISWVLLCGFILAALSLPNDVPTPSDLGLVLFLVVPGALWIAAAGVIIWRWRSTELSATEVAVPGCERTTT